MGNPAAPHLLTDGSLGADLRSGTGVRAFAGASSGEWQEVWDDASSSTYWYNTRTGDSKWTRPLKLDTRYTSQASRRTSTNALSSPQSFSTAPLWSNTADTKTAHDAQHHYSDHTQQLYHHQQSQEQQQQPLQQQRLQHQYAPVRAPARRRRMRSLEG